MNIIIAGVGKIGATLAKQLSQEGYDLTLIDQNASVLEKAIENCDAISINGNCATMTTLKHAGVGKANLLIAATDADEVNLLCCMTAHAINPNIHTIPRVRNPEYTEQIYTMRNSFGLSMTVNPDKQTAMKIDHMLKFPGFLKQDSFAKNRVNIVELKVEEGSKLDGIPLSSLNSIIKCQILVCVVLRDGNVIMPDGSFVLQRNDRILVTAATNVLTTLLDNIGIQRRKVKKVLITGGGRISYYLAQQLLKSNIAVEIIEQDYDRCLHLSALLPMADIIHGDATSHATLEKEGLSECDALISLTGFDEMNIVISLFGTANHVPQVITKLGHEENMNILNQLSIGSVICPKELCSDTIVRYVRAMRNQKGAAISVHTIASGLAEAVEFRADDNTRYCKVPLKNVKTKKDVLIVSITRNGNTEIPNGESTFQSGDTVIVVTSAGTILTQLNDIFE